MSAPRAQPKQYMSIYLRPTAIARLKRVAAAAEEYPARWAAQAVVRAIAEAERALARAEAVPDRNEPPAPLPGTAARKRDPESVS